MQARRFGVGLAAGLGFALFIIATSGALSNAPTFGTFNAALQQTTTGTAMNSSTTSMVTSQSTASTTSPPVAGAVGGNATRNNASTTTTTTASGSFPGASGNGKNADNAAASPAFSSRIPSLSSQPLASDVYILLPVLVAFLVGSLIYRTSRRSEEVTSQDG